MHKKTKKYLLIGAGIAALYYFVKPRPLVKLVEAAKSVVDFGPGCCTLEQASDGCPTGLPLCPGVITEPYERNIVAQGFYGKIQKGIQRVPGRMRTIHWYG